MKLAPKQVEMLRQAWAAGSEGMLVTGGPMKTAWALERRGLVERTGLSRGYLVVITDAGRGWLDLDNIGT